MSHVPFFGSQIDVPVEKVAIPCFGGYDTSGTYGVFVNKKIVQTCTEQYFVLDNLILYERFRDAADKLGIHIERLGTLRPNQSLVYIQSNFHRVHVGSDTVDMRLTFTNDHSGGMSFGLGHDTTTIICQNTFMYAHEKLETKIRHTNSLLDRLDNALDKLVEYQKREQEFVIYANELANTRANTDDFLKFVDLAANLKTPEGELVSIGTDGWDTMVSPQSVKKANKILDIGEFSMRNHGSNVWGAFSLFTNYTTHHRGKEDNRMVNKLEGVDNKAWNMALDMAGISLN